MHGRRPHRPLLGISGVVLFLCLFLPAVHTCEHDKTPLDYPFAWAPYFYGLAFALCACIGPRFVRAAVTIVRGTTVLFIAGALVLCKVAIVVGVMEALLPAALLWVLGTGAREARLALTTIVFGSASLVWFMFWSVSPDARYGLFLSDAASLAIVVAGVWWQRAVAIDDSQPAVPHAIVR